MLTIFAFWVMVVLREEGAQTTVEVPQLFSVPVEIPQVRGNCRLQLLQAKFLFPLGAPDSVQGNCKVFNDRARVSTSL